MKFRPVCWRWFVLGWVFWVGPLFAVSSFAAEDKLTAARLSVCVLPLENATGNANLDHWRETARVMLVEQLRDFKSLRVMHWSGVAYGMRAAKVDEKSAVTQDEAMRIGRELQVSRIIWGRFSRRGDDWEVSVRVGKIVDQTVSKELTATGNAWNTVIDSIEGQLLQELESKPGQLHRNQPSLRWAASPEALDLFSQGHADELVPAKAEDELRRATKADPKFVMSSIALAAVLATQGKMEPAKAAIEQALALNPAEPEAHQILGTVLLMQNLGGDLDGAAAELRKAIDLDADDSEANERLAVISFKRGELDQALEASKAAQQADPFDFHASALLVQAYSQKGDEADARAALADALRLQPTNHVDDNVLGVCYELLNDSYSAVQRYKHFIQTAREQGLNPDAVNEIEKHIADLEARLTPHFLSLAMPSTYTPEQLAKLLQTKLASNELALVTNPLESTPAMRAWAEKVTQGETNDFDKAKALFEDVTRQFRFDGSNGFRSAQGVFAGMDDKSASFNCLEGSHLYVALGRSIGLKVFLCQVERDYQNDVVYHACAALFVGSNALLVDPAYQWFGVPHKEVTVLDDLQAIGLDYFERGDLDSESALARCQIAEKLYPECELGIFNHLNLLCVLGKWYEARTLVPQAVKVNHDEWPLAEEQGILADHDGNDDLALSLFAKASRLNPGYGRLHFRLAETLFKNKKLDDAKAEYQVALRFELPPEWRSSALQSIAAINELSSASPAALRPAKQNK
jgi:tetratricopeptide (TPR) repeat protein